MTRRAGIPKSRLAGPLLACAVFVLAGFADCVWAADPKVRLLSNPSCSAACCSASWTCYQYEVCTDTVDIKDFHVHLGNANVAESAVDAAVCFQKTPTTSAAWKAKVNRDAQNRFDLVWYADAADALPRTDCGSGWGGETSIELCIDYGNTTAVVEGDPPGHFGTDGNDTFHESSGQNSTQNPIGTDSGPTFAPSTPSLTTWGLVILVLLMLASVAYALRRRRLAEGGGAANG